MEELLYELACQLFKVDNSEPTVKLLKKVRALNKGKYEESINGLDIDDLVGKKPKKKKLNSGVKGKTGERSLVKLFNERFAERLAQDQSLGQFYRVIQSGNRWSQATLSNNSKELYSGDIVCQNFKFVIESKNGYDDIDLISLFYEGSKELDSFLQQVTEDSNRCGKKPLLVWKKTRKPRLAFLRDSEQIHFKTPMHYKEWIIISFDELLKLPDEFFF